MKINKSLLIAALDEDEIDYSKLPNLLKAKSLLPKLVKAAQALYDKWNEEDRDTYAGGGICHFIADAFCDIFWKHDITCSSVSSSHEQHVYTVIQLKEGVYSVDIHPSTYETGGGFSWKKLPDVEFDNRDIIFYRVSLDPSEFNQYVED